MKNERKLVFSIEKYEKTQVLVYSALVQKASLGVRDPKFFCRNTQRNTNSMHMSIVGGVG